MRKWVTGLIILIAGLVMFGLFGDPFDTQFDATEPAVQYEATNKTPADAPSGRLEVATWNIKFAGDRIQFFFQCGGERVHMSRDEVARNLSGVITKIDQMDPDLIFLQEIDVNSKRTAYVDQVHRILENTDLNYAAYASQWKADYVPKKWLGPINSGHAILSRWPLKNPTRHALPLIDAQDPVTRYFYLKRSVLTAELELPEHRNPRLVGTHLAAFAEDGTKKEQLDEFKSHLDRLAEKGHSVIAAGDLNTLPPGSKRRSDFPDTRGCSEREKAASDYTDEIGYLDPFYRNYNFAIPLAEYRENNEPYFTYTGDPDGFWNRKLDYLFSNRPLENGRVHQNRDSGGIETMPLSDHAPMTASFPVTPTP